MLPLLDAGLVKSVSGGERLFEGGRFSIFLSFWMGAYSSWALIRRWALKNIRYIKLIPVIVPCRSHKSYIISQELSPVWPRFSALENLTMDGTNWQ